MFILYLELLPLLHQISIKITCKGLFYLYIYHKIYSLCQKFTIYVFESDLIYQVPYFWSPFISSEVSSIFKFLFWGVDSKMLYMQLNKEVDRILLSSTLWHVKPRRSNSTDITNRFHWPFKIQCMAYHKNVHIKFRRVTKTGPLLNNH